MFKDIKNKHVYDNAYVGFELQCYTPLDINKFSRLLSKYSGKTVGLNESNDMHIKKAKEGGKRKITIHIKPVRYYESIHLMLKTFNFINEYAFTDKKTDFNIDISVNGRSLDLPYRVEELNPFKYVLSLNEKKIFGWWDQSNKFKKKLNKNEHIFIYPRNIYGAKIDLNYIRNINENEYVLPQSSFFGFDLSHKAEGFVRLTYAGGKNYHKKKDESINLINYGIMHLYECLKDNNSYTMNEMKELKNVLGEYIKVRDSIKTYESLKKCYPNIKLLYDLKGNKRQVELNYDKYKTALFETIALGRIKKGIVNYDSDRNRVQFNKITIRRGFKLENVDFINSNIEADLNNCTISESVIRNSNIENCEILNNNEIRYSNIKKCSYLYENNEIIKSYINNDMCESLVKGKIKECVLEQVKLSSEAKVDDISEFL